MKQILSIFVAIFSLVFSVNANEPDSAFVFSYTTDKQNNTSGLHFAWSTDNENLHSIGPEFRFLASDFGRWGTQKKMINPVLFQDEKGLYHCLWTLNNEVGQFAHSASDDLKSKPFNTKVSVSEKFTYRLPGYSFSVIRIKTKL